MKLILKYFLYNIWNKKLRSFIIIFSIMITTLLVMANLGINNYFMATYDTNVKYLLGNIDIVISASKNSDELIKQGSIKLNSSDVKNSSEIFGGLGKIKNKAGKNIKINIIGADTNELKKLKVIDNEENDNNNGIVISKKALNYLGVNIGSELELDVLGQKYRNTVVNVADNSGVLAKDDENNITMVLPKKIVEQFYHSENKITNIYVAVKDGKDINNVMKNIENDNSGIDAQATHSIEDYKTQTDSISLALLFVLVITIFISVYLISFLFKVMGAERISVIGTFQSVGATKGEISLLFIGESLIYGILGFILGIGVSNFTLSNIYSMLNQFQTSNTNAIPIMEPVNILIAFAVAVGISLISSLTITFNINKIQVKNQIINTLKLTKDVSIAHVAFGIISFGVSAGLYFYNKNYNSIIGAISFLFLIIGGILISSIVVNIFTLLVSKTLGKFSGTLNLAMKNLETDKFLQGNITLITVMITMILTISIVITSVQSSMVSMLNQNDFDVSITSISSDIKTYDRISKIDGVNKMYYEYLAFPKAEAAEAGTQTLGNLSLIGMSKDQQFSDFHKNGVKYDKKLAEKLQDGDYIMVDSFFADKNNLKIRDKLLVTYDSEKLTKRKSKYEIIGFLDSSGFATTRDAAIISLDNMKRSVTKIPYQILVKLSDDKKKKATSDITDELIDTPAVVKTINQSINDSMQGVDGLISVLSVLMALVFVLVGFGVVNNLFISFLQRKRQIAVLSSVAMSNLQITCMFFLETIALFIISLGSSCILSYTICIMLPKMLWGTGLAFKFLYSWKVFGIVAIVLFILMILGTIITSLGLIRMKIIDELKYE
ncbi:ABC transporter permease [Clostridium sp. CM028]|uniref:ABC transporter permease n=1 Tax=unclassified Clostridium TaxID=2614128 RepID=UPI001C6DEB7F|nr:MULTISPECIES: ABC transporter permease [unclassified Clostridium]MBW9145948.1 ABC transporter permease [Clostridium sp. CM027]MBW9149635.1 ABC transporter permease [Clostridium sp. CM028]UVE40923.1 ABC transporter permease [Clostridium sp. CM027]WLC61590.1 ABC transporter permease [Clostridium sp. CM028]